MAHDVSDEIRYRLLKVLEERPAATQRELAGHLGISLGKVNYCLRALVERGLVKVSNFRNSPRKASYAYILTPRGIEEKINVTNAFLRRKIAEYEAIAAEIDRLSKEVTAPPAGERQLT